MNLVNKGENFFLWFWINGVLDFTCWGCCSPPQSHDSHRQKSKAAQPMKIVFSLLMLWQPPPQREDVTKSPSSPSTSSTSSTSAITIIISCDNLRLKGKVSTGVCHQMLSIDIHHRRIVNWTKPEPCKNYDGQCGNVSMGWEILNDNLIKNLSIILLSRQLLST